jgi:hypothetical protein
MKTWRGAEFSPSDEAQYGLGQHQEGIFNVRGVPISPSPGEHEHFDSISLSSKGYGIQEQSFLTDFNPADQT